MNKTTDEFQTDAGPQLGHWQVELPHELDATEAELAKSVRTILHQLLKTYCLIDDADHAKSEWRPASITMLRINNDTLNQISEASDTLVRTLSHAIIEDLQTILLAYQNLDAVTSADANDSIQIAEELCLTVARLINLWETLHSSKIAVFCTENQPSPLAADDLFRFYFFEWMEQRGHSRAQICEMCEIGMSCPSAPSYPLIRGAAETALRQPSAIEF